VSRSCGRWQLPHQLLPVFLSKKSHLIGGWKKFAASNYTEAQLIVGCLELKLGSSVMVVVVVTLFLSSSRF